MNVRNLPAIAGALVASIIGLPRCAGAVLETEDFAWRLGPDGRPEAFFDRTAGVDRLAPESPPFAEVRVGEKRASPVRCERRGDRLVLAFSDPDATLELAVRERPHYLVLEVASVGGAPIDEVAFGVLRLNLPGRASWISGAAIGSEFSAAVRALDPRVSLELRGGAAPLFRPVAAKRSGFDEVRLAVVACPSARLRAHLQELVRAEGLPWSPLGGPFALDAEENRGSYVFATVSEADADAWIALARRAGLAQIHLIGWERTLGHYEPRPDLYPGGLEGLRAVVAKIHAAGLRAGMHILTGGISRDDAFVTPVPDGRLAKDGRFTLAGELGEADAAVPILEPPGDLETSWQYSGRSNVVQIDGELIEYTALSTAPNALGGCRRGAFGTRAAPHAKGAPVHHLFAIYGTFQPDEDSTLVDEIAERIASVFNACGFDMIYQDGAEGMPGGAYGCARMREAIFRRLRGRVLVEASEWGHHSWPFHSRIGAYDHPNWGLKRFVDIHLSDAENYRASSFLSCQLGWWAILGPSADHRYELPEEIEYLSAKALACDMALSFQGIDATASPWNARQDEYLDLIGRYERLRLARAVPEEILARLREPRAEFRLEAAEGGGWKFTPLDCIEHKVTDFEGGSAAWRVANRRGPQPLRLRIEVLYSAAPFDSPEAAEILDPSRPGEVVPAGAAAGVSAQWSPAEGAGRPAALLAARSSLGSRRGAWAAFRKDFRPPLDLSRSGAIGVWVRGDARGEILNFQLTNPPQFWPTWDEHYVDVDFEGWRYFELHLRERDADRFPDFAWPYGGTSAVFRSPLIRTHVSALAVYVNELPPGAEASCAIGPARALPAAKARIDDPALEVEGARIVFPARLESGQFLEFDGGEEATIRDERGALVGSVRPRGAAPLLGPGENRLAFSCREAPEDAARGLRPRFLVTVFALGDPLLVPPRER